MLKLLTLIILFNINLLHVNAQQPTTIFEYLNIPKTNCIPPKVNALKNVEHNQYTFKPALNFKQQKNTFIDTSFKTLNKIIDPLKSKITNHIATINITEPQKQLYTFLSVPGINYKSYKIYSKGKYYITQNDKNIEISKDSFFYVNKALGLTYGINAYQNSPKSIFYNSKLKKIFTEQYDYIEDYLNGYYMVTVNNKIGVIDSVGAIVVPINYNIVRQMPTKTKMFFKVIDSTGCYIIEVGKPQKIKIEADYNYSYIIEDKYFVSNIDFNKNNEVVNLETNTLVFCGIKNNIVWLFAKTYNYNYYNLFYIKDSIKNKIILFNAAGIIINNQNLTAKLAYDIEGKFNNNLSIATINKGNNNYRGIMDTLGSWVLEPFYNYITPFVDSIFWVTKITNNIGAYGLINNKLDFIAPLGKYKRFEKLTLKNESYIICIDSVNSYLYALKNNTFKKLAYNYFEIISLGVNDIYRAYYNYPNSKNVYIHFVNSNLQIIDSFNYNTYPYFDYKEDIDFKRIFKKINNNLNLFSEMLVKPISILKNNNGRYGLVYAYFYIDSSTINNLKVKRFGLQIEGITVNEFRDIVVVNNKQYYVTLINNDVYMVKNGVPFFVAQKYLTLDTLLNGLIYYEGKKMGLLNYNNVIILPAIFNDISYQNNNLQIKYNNINYTLHHNANIAFKNNYDVVEPLFYNYFLVTKNKMKGIINTNGDLKLPIAYDKIFLENGYLFYENKYEMSVTPVFSLK